ncbi:MULTISPECIES: hypothetical protein [unclassified Anabaena]|uniref:hypothetical protein n=1 Tax=unclassified Anabaena TaxID=2619674 RepID=UPI0008308FEB|nr:MULTISPECIES: hypothetical protein [unclassified Anabaena]
MNSKKITLWVCALSIAIACVFVPQAITHTLPINSVRTIISDSNPKFKHEGIPHGVPLHYDWAERPKLNPSNSKNWRVLIGWGQLYEDQKGNPAKNTRVQIKNLKVYALSKSDYKWHLLVSSLRVRGRAYREDFKRDINIPADIRVEPDGSISTKAGNGYNFHFWNHKRVEFDPENTIGLLATAQARLIIDDLSKPDDRDRARYLLSIGGDYWSSMRSRWDNFTTNRDFGIGRFKYVTRQWRAFNLTTLSAADIIINPPPLE